MHTAPAGIMVSDEGVAEAKAFNNGAATEFVHDASVKGGVFQIANTWRRRV
jgi:hypothetical protein